MRQSAAIILSAAALVMFNSSAEARGFKMSFGKSSARAAAPVSKPVAANAATPTSRGTFVMIGGGNQNQNRPFAAATGATAGAAAGTALLTNTGVVCTTGGSGFCSTGFSAGVSADGICAAA